MILKIKINLLLIVKNERTTNFNLTFIQNKLVKEYMIERKRKSMINEISIIQSID